jgi:tryptophan synthase alpha chain
MELRNPTVVGFGISNRESFQAACEHTDGAIIGSAFLRAIADANDIPAAIHSFISSVQGG